MNPLRVNNLSLKIRKFSRKQIVSLQNQAIEIMGLINVYAMACTKYPDCGYLKPIATPEVISGLVDLLETCTDLFNPICELVSTITRTFKTCRYSSGDMLTYMIMRLSNGGMEP